MNIKKLPNGKYRYREKYQDEYKVWHEVNVTLNTKSRDAQREARNILERKIAENLEKCNEINEKAKNITVNEVYKQASKKREMELSPSSFSQETSFVKAFLKKHGNKRIQDVKARDLQDYIINHSKSVKTMHALKRGINSIFRYAYVAEYIETNPVDRLDLPKDTRTKQSIAKLKQKFFTLDEFNLLIQQMRADADDDETNEKVDLIEFLFWTGLRIGEALGLKWSDIDVLDSKISINKSWDYHIRKMGDVKTTCSIREIDINTRCLNIVQNFKKYNSEFVFVTPKGGHLHYQRLSQYLKFEGARTNIFGKNPNNFTLHMLRHSHVTYLINMGVPEKLVMERVGHSDPRMLMGVYTHVLPENRVTLRQALNYRPSWGRNLISEKSPINVPRNNETL
ncbi:tyrosine-type recombinase/integrase [Lactococcus allomyrinae]|nr:site-specific integrase [Lactococcus allomyrinae]